MVPYRGVAYGLGAEPYNNPSLRLLNYRFYGIIKVTDSFKSTWSLCTQMKYVGTAGCDGDAPVSIVGDHQLFLIIRIVIYWYVENQQQGCMFLNRCARSLCSKYVFIVGLQGYVLLTTASLLLSMQDSSSFRPRIEPDLIPFPLRPIIRPLLWSIPSEYFGPVHEHHFERPRSARSFAMWEMPMPDLELRLS